MAYNHEYPYTDPNRYNADWLLNKMKELENRLDGIVDETLQLTKKYVDERLLGYQSQIDVIERELQQLANRDEEISAELAAEVIRLEEKIAAAEKYADSLFVIANDRTDLQIERNNEFIFKEIEDNILANIEVINYFTGARTTVQNMFNYLATLHLANAITYFELQDKRRTYAELAATSITYTELVKNGAILI